MHKYTITIAAVITCLTTSSAHSMVRHKKTVCAIESKKRGLDLQSRDKTINFLGTLFEKKICDLSSAFEKETKNVQRNIEKSCGDAQGIIVLAKLPQDIQHMVLYSMLNNDKKSADQFYNMPLGLALTQQYEAHRRSLKGPIYLFNTPLHYGRVMTLSSGTCFRLSPRQHKVLADTVIDIYPQQNIPEISHATKDIIATIPHDILEMVLQTSSYKLLPTYIEKANCSRLALVESSSSLNFFIPKYILGSLFSTNLLIGPLMDKLYFKKQIQPFKNMRKPLRATFWSYLILSGMDLTINNRYQRSIDRFMTHQPALRFDDLGTNQK